MFGSISNWISENKPTIPTVSLPTVNVSMPSMPAMPTMTMPSMPAMPTMHNPFKKSEEAPKEGEETLTTNSQNELVEQEQTTVVVEKKPDTPVDLNNIEAVATEKQQTEEEANPDAAGGDQEDGEKANDGKFGFRTAPTKAMGAAKDIGNNIGSKF